MKLRVAFSKKGPVKFIGHLDTQRFFQRALKRAGWDVAYSQGFSPHPILSFAAPLGVGLESDSEIFDIEMVTAGSREDLIDSLNAASCEGFTIIDVRVMDEGTGNAMASVAAASYTVDLAGAEAAAREAAGECGQDGDTAPMADEFPDEWLDQAVAELNAKTELIISKKTKKSELQVDIKPGIYELKSTRDGLYMLVDASSGGNVRPEQVTGALYELAGRKAPDVRLKVTRNQIYGRTPEGGLKPLIEFGHAF